MRLVIPRISSNSVGASSRPPTREFARFFLSLKVCYRVHKDLPLCPILSEMNLTHLFQPKIYFNITHLCLGLKSGFFPSLFSDQYFVTFLFSPSLLAILPISSSLIFFPPPWSSGQSDWLLTQGSRFRFPALPDFSEQQWVWNGVHSAS
jgi:hypothetical protein